MNLNLTEYLKKDVAKTPTEKLWHNLDFINWLDSHNIQHTPGQIPEFKEGGVGRAYFLNDYVVKFTRDQAEANIAQAVSQRNDVPAAVIDVKTFPPVYAILTKKLDTNVPKDLKDAADALMAWLDEHPRTKTFPPDKQPKIAKEALNLAGFSQTLTPNVLKVMNALNQLYQATGYLHNDAGPTNLALDYKGDIAFFDLGPNLTSSFNTKSFLNKIQKNQVDLGLQPFQII